LYKESCLVLYSSNLMTIFTTIWHTVQQIDCIWILLGTLLCNAVSNHWD